MAPVPDPPRICGADGRATTRPGQGWTTPRDEVKLGSGGFDRNELYAVKSNYM